MTTKKICGPWIKWHGGECPVPPETMVEVKLRRMAVMELDRADEYEWRHIFGRGDIVEYCIVTEQAELEAAEQLLSAQLAEAQRDSERLDWMIEQRAYVVSDPDCCDGYWLRYHRKDNTLWVQATEHETPRAAIDAAMGKQ